MDFKEQYKQYEETLTALNDKCSSAERQSIVGETNLTNLCNQRDALIDECEAFTGVTIDKVPDILQQQQQELDAIMSKLSTIDINGPITQEKLDAVKSIVDEFSITQIA